MGIGMHRRSRLYQMSGIAMKVCVVVQVMINLFQEEVDRVWHVIDGSGFNNDFISSFVIVVDIGFFVKFQLHLHMVARAVSMLLLDQSLAHHLDILLHFQLIVFQMKYCSLSL